MVTTSGGVPAKHGPGNSEFSTGLPVGNKGPKGGKGKSKQPSQPKKVGAKKYPKK